MNYRFLLLILMSLSGHVCYGQSYETFDKIEYVCTYDYYLQQDSASKNSVVIQEMVLQVGNHSSKFAAKIDVFQDSALCANQGQDMATTATMLIPTIMGMSKTTVLNDYKIFKNYPQSGTITLDAYLSNNDKFKVVQPMNIKWNTVAGDTVIYNYRCSKATTTFAGRFYTAWFTPEVPINDGPYKFCGLPGLIVKIEDSKQEHCFILTGVTRCTVAQPIVRSNSGYADITPKQFVNAIRNYSADMYRLIQSGEGKFSGLTPEQRAKAMHKMQMRNNFIEKY